MHILLVTYEFPPAMATGGIGSYMYHLAHLLYNKGHKVSVISATNEKSEQITDAGFCMNYLIPAVGHEEFRHLALNCFERNFEPDTIDLLESPEVGACALAIALKYPDIPLLVKMHTPGVLITKISNSYQSLFTKLRFVAGALLRGRIDLGYWSNHDRNRNSDPEYIICQKANVVLSPSVALKKWAMSYWQLSSEKIRVIGNPFSADQDLFSYPISNRPKQICFIGKLSVLKGMFALTPAVKKILQEFPDYKFFFVGRDEWVSPEIPSMKKWMEARLENFKDRVVFTGALGKQSVKDVLVKSEICVVPSLWENYPTVILEAMAAGTAVVAADRGGIPEIIVHKKNGVLINALRSKEIATAITTLINDFSYRERIANEARMQLQKHKDLSEKLDELYTQVSLTFKRR